MRCLVAGLGVFLVIVGTVRLTDEVAALKELPDGAVGFANGDGITAALEVERLKKALLNGDQGPLQEVVAELRLGAPFDPVLLSWDAILKTSGGMQASAKLFDQAAAIVPHDHRVQTLRMTWQARLHTLSLQSTAVEE